VAAGGGVMAGIHAVLSGSAWPVDLLVSAGAGVAAYAVALLAAGLKPSERATALSVARRAVGR
jgi:predicted anti-sigma-YlaC factor YlaD